MRILSILALVLCLTITMATPFTDTGRTFHPFSTVLNKLLGYSKCGSRACPSWKCQDDSAVIHGYCCKCPGSRYDNVPVPCYPDLKCPVSSQPLCSDYEFMMECCCNGP